ncbi:hypothetical protein JU57_06475 [Sulfurospirillum sp. SCADC]|nr:hypothetical protein JU57_06475 [Sulfurospirillum sp. SCADC]
MLLFATDFKNSSKDLMPIIVVVIFFQIAFIKTVPENLVPTSLGLLIVALGLALFIRGLEIGIFPIGEALAHDFAHKGSLFWLLCFSFLIGFSTTIAEPALIAIANKAALISEGKIDAFYLRITVALSVGCAIALGALRILWGHPIHYYIITGYILVVGVTFFAPKEIIGLAYDSGGVTTSTVTVPLVAALGIGLSSCIKGRNPLIDGFGLIAFASLTPMIFVQIFGLIVYYFTDTHAITTIAMASKEAIASSEHTLSFTQILLDLLGVMQDVLPIILVIAFFQYVIIQKPIAHLPKILTGIVLVILGLDAFIVGLEIGLFPIGETIAYQLTTMKSPWVIYLFGAMIGFATTMAEPALIAIAMKASEVSNGNINQTVLRIFVAIGVAIGIALGCFRLVNGASLHYFIIIGYSIVIIMTYFAPKYIVPIAYDSGGVTTSTVTVPLVAALGLGLAQNIEGRDPLIDGFGLIAFASLFPMITVMGYGIITQRMIQRSEK